VERVKCDDVDANLEQVKRGMAWNHVKYSNNPTIGEDEREARERGSGALGVEAPLALTLFVAVPKTCDNPSDLKDRDEAHQTLCQSLTMIQASAMIRTISIAYTFSISAA
jgi:hypothetical protein